MVEGLSKWTLEFRDPAIERDYRDDTSRKVLSAYRLLVGLSLVLFVSLAFLNRYTAGSAANYRVEQLVRFSVSPLLVASVALGWAPAAVFSRFRQLGGAVWLAVMLCSRGIMGLTLPDPGVFDMRAGALTAVIGLLVVLAFAGLLGLRFRDLAIIGAVSMALGLASLPRYPAFLSGVVIFWYVAAGAMGVFVARQIDLARRGEFLATRKLAAERKRSEDLLYNVLPEGIAERLKADPTRIAEHFDEVTVLFADIAGFTPMSASMAPAEIVAILDDVFTEFDEIAHRHGLEKIKTIGDAYMLVGGIPEPRADHAEAVAQMAVEMRDLVAGKRFAKGRRLEVRIGIHTGPVVAGVIGKKKFVYDLWGDTVNTASRMESHGEPGRIQVTAAVRERLAERYALESRGIIDVKGKGPMPTWFLERPAPDAPHAAG